MRGALLALLVLAAVAAPPGVALGQSAGDDQYVDPFQGDTPASEQAQPEPAPEQQPAPAPATPAAPAEGGDGTAEAAQTTAAPTLPRSGLPVLAVALAGGVLLASGAVLRRRC